MPFSSSFLFSFGVHSHNTPVYNKNISKYIQRIKSYLSKIAMNSVSNLGYKKYTPLEVFQCGAYFIWILQIKYIIWSEE